MNELVHHGGLQEEQDWAMAGGPGVLAARPRAARRRRRRAEVPGTFQSQQ